MQLSALGRRRALRALESPSMRPMRPRQARSPVQVLFLQKTRGAV